MQLSQPRPRTVIRLCLLEAPRHFSKKPTYHGSFLSAVFPIFVAKTSLSLPSSHAICLLNETSKETCSPNGTTLIGPLFACKPHVSGDSCTLGLQSCLAQDWLYNGEGLYTRYCE
jgi:hypothetical protein